MSKTNGFEAKDYALGVQHLFAMFGATVLVPILTGLNPSVALVSAGIGTIAFHLITKRIVPVFLGSSFAFIAAIAMIVKEEGVQQAQSGIIAAGLIYLALSLIVYLLGPDKIKKFLPAVVTGPIIIIIGINLSKVAIGDCLSWKAPDVNIGLSITIALITFAVVLLAAVLEHGFFKLVPILIGLAVGYLLCVILHLTGLYTMDFSAFSSAKWFNMPFKDGFMTLPKYSLSAIIAIAPIALVTFMEHIGDITTNGKVVGKDFFKDPGLHRTVLGDGIATLIAGFIGGPPNTTYGENTGVLATTKNYNPAILRMAAVFAIILGLFGKLGAVLQTIPAPVKGGVEVILFGMIAAIGIRTLAESKLDFTHSRNLIIVGAILVCGLGFSDAANVITVHGVNLSGLFIATVVGIILNLVVPANEDTPKKKKT